MERNKYLLLHDQRQSGHNLILKMHRTGLSPPENIIGKNNMNIPEQLTLTAPVNFYQGVFL